MIHAVEVSSQMLDPPPPLGSTLKSAFRVPNNQFIGYILFPSCLMVGSMRAAGAHSQSSRWLWRREARSYDLDERDAPSVRRGAGRRGVTCRAGEDRVRQP